MSPYQLGVNYKTLSPLFEDDAQIEEAFYLYHYGVDGWDEENPTTIPLNSIEGRLSNFSGRISNVESEVSASAPYLKKSPGQDENIIVPTQADITPLYISSPYANFQEWQNSSLSPRAIISGDRDGYLAMSGYCSIVATPSSSIAQNIEVLDPSHSGIVVKSSASQVANIQEWQNNSGQTLSFIDKSGNVGQSETLIEKTSSFQIKNEEHNKKVILANSSSKIQILATQSEKIGTTVDILRMGDGEVEFLFPQNIVLSLGYETNSSAISVDGENWFEGTLPQNLKWIDVAYGSEKFVAIAFDSSIYATSEDGILWQQRSLPYSSLWYAIAYGNDLFVAISSNSSSVVTSTDGLTWTQRYVGNGTWRDIKFGNGIFAITGFNAVAASSNGSTWTTGPAPLRNETLAFGNNRFVAVSYGKSISRVSYDGINYEDFAMPFAGNYQDISYGNGVFVVVSGLGNYTVTSTDGENWFSHMNSISNRVWDSLSFLNEKFIAIAAYGNYSAISQDGISWTEYGNTPYNAIVVSSTTGEVFSVPISESNKNAISSKYGYASLSKINENSWHLEGSLKNL